MAFEFAVQLFY